MFNYNLSYGQLVKEDTIGRRNFDDSSVPHCRKITFRELLSASVK